MAILDDSGIFKYIQIDIKSKQTKQTKSIVRGYKEAAHSEISDKFMNEELKDIPHQIKMNWEVTFPGGGVIKHVNTRKIN